MFTNEHLDSALFHSIPRFEVSISDASKVCPVDVDDLTLTLFKLDSSYEFLSFFEHYIQSAILQGVNRLSTSDEKYSCYRIPLAISTEHFQYELILLFKQRLQSEVAEILIVDLSEFKDSKMQLEELMLRYELVVEGAFGAVWDWDLVSQSVHFSEAGAN